MARYTIPITVTFTAASFVGARFVRALMEVSVKAALKNADVAKLDPKIEIGEPEETIG